VGYRLKWKKHGWIFDPSKHRLPNRCTEFAQSPQALVLSDRVRVYFSTRERDVTGKFLSHVAYVDFKKDMKEIIEVSKNAAIELGPLGSFDEHGIFPFSIFADGTDIKAYTTGWSRRASVSAETSIGFASSSDGGRTFVKSGVGPIMTSSLHEPFLVADSCLLKVRGEFHMWYIYGLRWKKFEGSEIPERVYKIAHASSADGLDWRRDGETIIPDRIDIDECQALPTVFESRGRFHMYFCYRAARGFREDPRLGYRLGYAYSDDLVRWTRNDDYAGIDVSRDGWDSRMQCYPNVFRCDDKVYMLYNGNEFGRFGFGLAELESDDEN
jgi:sucrose-6-phosphate hydrolase SacC (GH32 family)